jgi:hypothetical protein
MRSAQYTAGTTAIKIADQTGSNRKLSIHVETSATYLGDRGVTSTTGYKMDANDKITLDLAGGAELWAVTASGSAPVYVLEI